MSSPSIPTPSSAPVSPISPLSTTLDQYIAHQFPYEDLPPEILSNHHGSITGHLSRDSYYRHVRLYCIDRQIGFERTVLCTAGVMQEKEYYAEMLHYLRTNLRMYPYHLADFMVSQLKVLPFQYYVDMLHQIMTAEKSYDVLPNFTAADVHRLMGIGRNQFIDIMNQVRSKRWAWKFKKGIVREYLPTQCLGDVEIDYWWLVNYNAHMSQQDFVRVYNAIDDESQKLAIGMIKKESQVIACKVSHSALQGLYSMGLVRLDVPISGEDYIVVPPLKNFIMNRAPNDPFEKLLYDVLVTIDERTSVSQLAETLEVEEERIRNAVSICCRLGFAKKKLDKPYNIDDAIGDQFHPSWKPIIDSYHENIKSNSVVPLDQQTSQQQQQQQQSLLKTKRIGFLFDSSLTAYLMMGNLAEGLKNHAVTLFEVGKLQDEMLDSFLAELDKVKTGGGEGEARRYYQHALTLRHTLRFLRHNSTFDIADCDGGVDMVRCESLSNLDPGTKLRILDLSYSAIITMAPLAPGSLDLPSCVPNFYGPPIQQIASPWFKLFMYSQCGLGPSTIFYPKGVRLRKLPQLIQSSHKVMLAGYDQEHITTSTNILLQTLNDALTSSPQLVQVHESEDTTQTFTYDVPFPMCYDSFEEYNERMKEMRAATPISTSGTPQSPAPPEDERIDALGYEMPDMDDDEDQCTPDIESEEEFQRVKQIVDKLVEKLHLSLSFGFVRIMKSVRYSSTTQDDEDESSAEIVQLVPLDLHIGIPLSNEDINRAVCDAINKRRLLQKDSLAQNSNNMRRLVEEFLEFVDVQIDGNLRMSVDSHAIYPTRIIHFDGSELSSINTF